MIVHLALRELRDDRDLFFLVPVPQPLEGLPTTPFGRRIRKEPMLHLPAVAKIGSLYVPSFSFFFLPRQAKYDSLGPEGMGPLRAS
jgi:hypothetical protein